MLRWRIGEVKEIIDETLYIQILKLAVKDGEALAINYLQFHQPLVIGQKAIINTTATSLKLGSGGYDFVVFPYNSKEGREDNAVQGHIMKLRYTPYQFSVQSCEEQSSKHHHIFKEPKMLNGLPVLVGELHSMLPIVITLYRQFEIKRAEQKHRIVYIMTDGGALPIAFSEHVAQLKQLGWLTNTITVGNAFGGDLEAVNVYTALIAAKYIYNAELVIVLMGPGITGTNTLLGHTGIEQGIIINAVASLKGKPIAIIRASQSDIRERHSGISHHTISTLKYITLVKSILPYPDYIASEYPLLENVLKQELGSIHDLKPVKIDHEEIKNELKKYPYVISTMGKTIEEEPLYYDFVASSVCWVFNFLH